MTTALVGVDIGGTGIKGGIVDPRTGDLVGERVRVETPRPAVPDAVLAATAGVIAELGATAGPVGIGLPSAIVGGRAATAANIDESWLGEDVTARFSEAIGRPCALINDADAAGLAEMRFGAGRGVGGVVLLLTLGTGIGSALFLDGRLVPNTELGHIKVRGKDGEARASANARERKGLSYRAWAPILNEYLDAVDALIWPDLIIIGGGVSKKADRFLPLLSVRPPIVAATLRNEAGIVGAAMRARELSAVAAGAGA
ncbi:MAG: polyphosphate--glucose phosphotransferase [Thermoleophilia bacterium]